MEIVLQSIDIELWYFVVDGAYETKIVNAMTSLTRLKTRQELNEKDRTYLSLNAKAVNVIYNALDTNEPNRVKGYKLAIEIWSKLNKIHESNLNIKEQKNH